MTENKRFTIQGIGISDHKKKRLYDLQTIDGFISVRDELNALHEENQRFHQILEDMLQNERTHIGQSVLKQYKEAIQNE